MGPIRQARVREVRQRWRRRSDEYEEPIQFPKGYSRNGVFGPTRGMEGHGCFPEALAPSAAIAADDAGANGSEKKEGDASMLAPEALVHVKQEQSVDTDGESRTLRIDNFRRPFTLNAVKAFVQQCGPMEDGGFWMDRIKTHCFVTFASMDVARAAKAVIDGTVWPSETGQELSVSFATMTAMEVIANGPPPAPTTPRTNAGQLQPGEPSDESETVPRARVIRGRGAPAPISSRFRKTDTKPMLYYLPVSKSEVKFRKRNREEGLQGLHDGSVKKQK